MYKLKHLMVNYQYSIQYENWQYCVTCLLYND